MLSSGLWWFDVDGGGGIDGAPVISAKITWEGDIDGPHGAALTVIIIGPIDGHLYGL